MSERKHKRELRESLIESNREELEFVLEPAQIEVGSGYAISVSYNEDDNPIIDVKTYGDVNIAKLRKDIERLYPNAQIRHLSKEPSVTVVKRQSGRSKVKKKKISRQKF
jgi:hypothetical protein